MHNKKTSKKPAKKAYIVSLVIFILISSGFVYYLYRNSYRGAEITQEENVPTINLEPPTEVEQQAGDEQKKEIIERDENISIPNTAKVVIVDASQYDSKVEVRAFAANVISDGTCVITFTKGAASIQKEVAAFADASSSPCISLTVPRSEFTSNGEWSVTVVYNSATIRGSSTTTLEIN